MVLCNDCTKSVRHEGTPLGTFENFGGVETYVTLPSGDHEKHKAVLFLTDVFGPHALHAQLLADDYARSGYQVFVPDYVNGEPVTEEMRAVPGFDIMKDWLPRHTQTETRPSLDKVIAVLKQRGITTFGCTGYCFGGRYGVDLAIDNVVKTSVIAHPGLVAPADFETLRDASHAQFMIVSCEDDFSFGPELQLAADGVLGAGRYAPGYERKFYAGCRHGFAVRADPKDPVAKAGKEDAFRATVEWFRQTL